LGVNLSASIGCTHKKVSPSVVANDAGGGVPRLGAPTRMNERWSLDFVLDVLGDGFRI
jgi:hypothetical protein